MGGTWGHHRDCRCYSAFIPLLPTRGHPWNHSHHRQPPAQRGSPDPRHIHPCSRDKAAPNGLGKLPSRTGPSSYSSPSQGAGGGGRRHSQEEDLLARGRLLRRVAGRSSHLGQDWGLRRSGPSYMRGGGCGRSHQNRLIRRPYPGTSQRCDSEMCLTTARSWEMKTNVSPRSF